MRDKKKYEDFMKNVLRHLSAPGFVLALVLFSVHPSASQSFVLVPENAAKRVLVPTAAISASWRTSLDFAADSWTVGTGGVGYERDTGYESWIQIPVGDLMYNASGTPNRSCCIRIRFQATGEQIASTTVLNLNIRYDDGFIAYLNGTKIAEANAPSSPAWDSPATANHEASETPEIFDVSEFLSRLKDGENLLALQVFNVSASSSDFLCTVKLTLEERTSPSGFESSNLPIVVIDTHGQGIPNDPKITADMGIIDNGPGERNSPADPFNGYMGKTGIETRGSTSQTYPKKNYAFETRKNNGDNLNASLLGMPPENDWILYGPFTDRSLMRDVLMYRLSNAIGLYAPRSRYCELVLNGEYRGVYALLEKIKRDGNRVDVSELHPEETAGDSLTGGYILKIDKWDGEGNDGFENSVELPDGSVRTAKYQYHYPRPDSIVQEQKDYIQSFIRRFEETMAGPDFSDAEKGYPKWIDVDSFVDYFILQEISKNVDGYRLSAFLSKDKDSKGGKLHAGPIWDFNLAFGNANYYDGWDTDDWMVDVLEEFTPGDFYIPFWWFKLAHERNFKNQASAKWRDLRAGVLATDALHTMIDSIADTLGEAQSRNFAIWPAPGEPGTGFWPVPAVFYSFSTYQDEVDYLKSWIEERLVWMDANISRLAGTAGQEPAGGPWTILLRQNHPNPFNAYTRIEYELSSKLETSVIIRSLSGRRIRTLVREVQGPGLQHAVWDGRDDSERVVPTGIYLVELISGGVRQIRKMTVLK
jgi:hypothetical protein